VKTIPILASQSYEVQIGTDLLSQVGEKLKALLPKARIAAVVTDSNVEPLYYRIVAESLLSAGFFVVSFVFPAGEQSKNGETYLHLLECLAQNQLTRSDVLLALGGGVVGDLTGFAAATYLRGIPYLQIPTTLLAMVDSSVGGKTAIDLLAGKNLAGAFYQPRLVLCDVKTLNTLPETVFYDGCAEVIKYGMLGSVSLLFELRDHPIKEQLETVIAQCVTMKRDIVERDEFDTGDRQLLNLGHTIGHAIERCSQYTISHGKAVAIGMAVMTRAAIKKKLCSSDCTIILESLLALFCLPSRTEFSAEQLYEAALGDKKRSGGLITLVVPTSLGKSERIDVPIDKLRDWIEMGLAL
jgi:3-dehydroquinate synthase